MANSGWENAGGGGGNYWVWERALVLSVMGGIMVLAAVLWFSTGCFGALQIPGMPVQLQSHLGFLGGSLKRLKLGVKKRQKKKVRVYMDGCFDLIHYGHANALRQARAIGDELVVDVVSDEEIIANKGPLVLSLQERITMVKGIKWVDEDIADAPYAINESFMKKLYEEIV